MKKKARTSSGSAITVSMSPVLLSHRLVSSAAGVVSELFPLPVPFSQSAMKTPEDPIELAKRLFERSMALRHALQPRKAAHTHFLVLTLACPGG